MGRTSTRVNRGDKLLGSWTARSSGRWLRAGPGFPLGNRLTNRAGPLQGTRQEVERTPAEDGRVTYR